MKTNSLYIILLLILFGFSSCDKDTIEEIKGDEPVQIDPPKEEPSNPDDDNDNPGDEDDDNTPEPSLISPPDWLLGTWDVPELRGVSFKFTKDNFFVTMGNTTYDFGELSKMDIYTVRENFNTNKTYHIEKIHHIMPGTTSSESYSFSKSGNDIFWNYLMLGGFYPVPYKMVKR